MEHRGECRVDQAMAEAGRDSPRSIRVLYLAAFLAFFSAFFSFIVFAGFFLVSFFCSMPLAMMLS